MVRLWNVVRSEEEILATFDVPLTGAEPGSVGCWRFDEGMGQVVLDSSPRGNDGTLGSTDGVESTDPVWVEVG